MMEMITASCSQLLLKAEFTHVSLTQNKVRFSSVKIYSLYRVVAGEGDQSSKGKRERVEHLSSSIQPRGRIRQLF